MLLRRPALGRDSLQSGSVAVGCWGAVSGDTELGQGQWIGNGHGTRGQELSEMVRLLQQAPEADQEQARKDGLAGWKGIIQEPGSEQ